MFKQNYHTWTLCLLFLAFIPEFCLSASLAQHANASKTMYDVFIEKCPLLEGTTLPDSLKDIINKKCTNWTAINATNSLTNEGKDEAQCLVFYESLLSFCKSMGADFPKTLNLLATIATFNNQTSETICSGNNSLYSLDYVEHNLTGILPLNKKPINCILLCTELGKDKPVVYDICKYSYYFASFNTSKYLLESLKRHPEKTQAPLQNSAQVNPPSAAVLKDHKLNDNAPQNIPAEVPHDNNIKSQADTPVKKPQATGIGNEESKPNGVAPVKELPPHEQVIIANKDPETQNNLPPKKEEVQPAIAPDKNIDDSARAPAQPEQNQIAIPENAPVNVNEGQAENVAEKDPDDGPDEGGFAGEDEDAEPEDINIKPMPVLPNETDEKIPLKIGKPSTVEDEPVNANNWENDSRFFTLFVIGTCCFVIGYITYHNRQKLLALVLEGKRGRRTGRRNRRPNSANYHKLDSNLEEAMSSSCTKNPSNVIY